MSSSMYAHTEPAACRAKRPVSNRMFLVPNEPLSITALAEVIFACMRCLLIFVRHFCTAAMFGGLRSRSAGLFTRKSLPRTDIRGAPKVSDLVRFLLLEGIKLRSAKWRYRHSIPPHAKLSTQPKPFND